MKKIKKLAHHDVIELLNTEKAKQRKQFFLIVDFLFNSRSYVIMYRQASCFVKNKTEIILSRDAFKN